MSEKELCQYIHDEQVELTNAMEKSGREDFWYSDFETAITRAVEKEKEVFKRKILKKANRMYVNAGRIFISEVEEFLEGIENE